jgi:3-oxoacyl-[acyl-carrier-protein] synthase-3
MFATLKSIGAYAPSNILTNADLEKIVDTSDEWIVKRTGIKTRHIASKDEATSDMAHKAALQAIQRADLQPTDIDAVIVATITPDYMCMPSTACVVADKLGIKDVMAFDISAACSGFVYLLSIAKSFIESGFKKNILIIGAEKLSAFTDYSDRGTCILFGDGAGAAVIGSTKQRHLSILDVNASSDGSFTELLITPGCGSKNPCSQEVLDANMHFMKMSGNEIFKIAVKTLTKDVKDILEKNNLSKDAIDHFIPHQANYRIIKAVQEMIEMEDDKCVLTVHKYGNTSAASIPMAINDRYEEGKLKKGDLMLLDTFGGGLTWGSALVHFGL